MVHRIKRNKDSNEHRWSSSTNSSTPGSPAPLPNYYGSATPTRESPSNHRQQASYANSQYSSSSAFTAINNSQMRLRVVDCKPRPQSVHSPFQNNASYSTQPMPLHGSSTMNLMNSNQHITSNLCRSYSQVLKL